MNQREHKALSTEWLTNEARALYLLCLRWHMDYRTGVVGRTYTLSWNTMKERVEVRRQRGSKLPDYRPDSRAIRWLLELLRRAGLAEPLGEPLVFRLPLATTDLDRLDEEQQRNNTSEQQQEQGGERMQERQQHNHPDCQGKQLVEYADCLKEQHQEQGWEGQQERHLENGDEQHTSVGPYYSPTTTTRAPEKFAMFAEWVPSDQFSMLCRRAGVGPEGALVNQAVTNFVAHHLSHPGRRESQARWEALLVRWVQGDRARGAAAGSGSGGRVDASARVNRRQRVTSAVMNLDDISW